MLKEIILQVELGSGITYNYKKECRVIKGYSVAIYPKRERSIKSLDEKNLIHYINKNYVLLHKEENCLGIWYHNGYYILDIVRVVFDFGVAVDLAKAHKQTAIYDLDRNKTIYI